MELKEFIKSSLLGIADGIMEANQERKKLEGKSATRSFVLPPGGGDQKGHGIEFDLAVTTKAETATGGKAGVSISVVELSTGGKSHEAKESVSRINFVVKVEDWLG